MNWFVRVKKYETGRSVNQLKHKKKIKLFKKEVCRQIK